MKKLLFTAILLCSYSFQSKAQLNVYHPVLRDANGVILPWYNPHHGTSYDHCLSLIWDFWQNIDTCCGGHKFYMIDHSYNNPISGNKLGGDQFAMILSSWRLYYAYTGDTNVVKDMQYIADTYLANSLSGPNDSWPNFPYPCNPGNPLTAVYDGDFLLNEGYTMPDKAGSFANELVTLYKITGNDFYLQNAISIANTLAAKVEPGDGNIGPFPYRVNAHTGDLPPLLPDEWSYTSTVVPTLLLFEQLKGLNQGNTVAYDTATAIIHRWVKQYPLQTNEWGSFFEDIPVPSNTEINAVSMAWYILNHPDAWGSTWQQDARGILDWSLGFFGSHAYDTLGVTAIYEQSADLKEAGSHTSRYAATELLYYALTGDTTHHQQAILQLDWANYLVNFDGMTRFTPPSGAIWYTDGYGDYVRHYLRAMAADPTLTSDSAHHLLETSSVISFISYNTAEIHYNTFDNSAVETFKLTSKPSSVKADGIELTELISLNGDGFTWEPYAIGGLLKVKHTNAKHVDILWPDASIESFWNDKRMQIFPNPASGLVNITFDFQEKNNLVLELIDVLGNKVEGVSTSLNPTSNAAQMAISNVSPGIYLVKLSCDGGQACRRLVVE